MQVYEVLVCVICLEEGIEMLTYDRQRPNEHVRR
jgi:hypothetical protein